MHDGQYMLPVEFVAVVGFLFAPPLLLALVAQSIAFVTRRVFASGHVGRAVVGYASTVFGSLIIGVVIHQFSPQALSPLLRVREVSIGSHPWPVMPLAFLAVAVAATAATFWVLGGAHAEA